MRRLVNFSGLLPLSKKIHLGTILYGNFSTISVFVPLTKFTASLCFINFVYHNICRLCCKFVCQLKDPFGGTCQGQTQYANPIMLGWGWGCPPPPISFPLCSPCSLTLVVVFHTVTSHWGISSLMDENHPDCDNDDRKCNADELILQ